MPPPAPKSDRTRPLWSRLGFIAATFAVFASGWIAVSAKDWRIIVLSAIGALIAAYLASTFRRAGG